MEAFDKAPVKKAENIYTRSDDTKKTGNYRASYPLDPDKIINPFELKQSQDDALKLSTENPIGSGLVASMADGVIGSGLSLESVPLSNVLTVSQSKISRNAQIIEDYWNLWSKSREACDKMGEQTFGMITRSAGIGHWNTGDVLQFIGIHNWHGVYVPYVKVFDGRSVCNRDNASNTKNMVSGIALDENGRATGYTIKTEIEPYNYDYKDVKRFAKYPGSDLDRLQYNLVVSGRVSPSQRRGRPLILPSMNNIIMMSKFSEAEMTKAIIQSYITAFVTRDKDLAEKVPNPTTSSDGLLRQLDEDKQIGETGEKDTPITMGPGYVQTLKPGENIELPESKSPVADFWKFMEGQLKFICMSIQVPYEVALEVFNTNYSASQAAIQAAARRWDIERKSFAMQFVQPVYDLFVWLLQYQGLVNMPGFMEKPFVRSAWCNANWHGPVVLNIDPVKNAKSATARLENMTTTFQDEARKLGSDFEAIARRRASEQELLKSLGLVAKLDPGPEEIEEPEEPNSNTGGQE